MASICLDLMPEREDSPLSIYKTYIDAWVLPALVARAPPLSVVLGTPGRFFSVTRKGIFFPMRVGFLFIPSRDWNWRSVGFPTRRGTVARCAASSSQGDAQVIEIFRQIPQGWLRLPCLFLDVANICFDIMGLGAL